MGFKDFYNDTVNKDNQRQAWLERIAPIRAIYTSCPDELLERLYNDTLPRPETDFFKEAVEVIEDHVWVRCKESYDESSCTTSVRCDYEEGGTDYLIGGTIDVDISDPIRQIQWPDGTLHLYELKGIWCEKVPKKKVGFFDSFRSVNKRFPKEQKRAIGLALKKADDIVRLTRGSQEYVDLKFSQYGDSYRIVIFRDGNAYGNKGPSDNAFYEGLAEAIKKLNQK